MFDHRTIQLGQLVMAGLWIAIQGVPSGGQTEAVPCGKEVLLTVNGESVTRNDLQVTDEAVRKQFSILHGRAPDLVLDDRELSSLRQGLEAEALAKQARSLVRQQQVRRLRIDVSEEELRRRWEKHREQFRPGEDDRWQAKARALAAAISAVYDGGADAEVVYSRDLASVMSREEWQSHLQRAKSPEVRGQIRVSSEKDDWTFEDSKEFIQRVVVAEKLNAAIDTELTAADPEYAEYVRLLAIDPGNRLVAQRGPIFQLAKRDEWWRARYREARIEVVQPEFKDVIERIAK